MNQHFRQLREFLVVRFFQITIVQSRRTAETLAQTFMGAKCYRAMRHTEQRHSPRRIAKPPELSGLFPQFGPQCGTISMKDDRGKKALFAHVNPMTGAKESILPTPLRQQILGGSKGTR